MCVYGNGCFSLKVNKFLEPLIDKIIGNGLNIVIDILVQNGSRVDHNSIVYVLGKSLRLGL